MDIKPITTRRIYQEIIGSFIRLIANEEINVGDKLPSENGLVKEFGISKQTLRESLRALEHMGLIESRKGTGGGTFVIEVDSAVTKLSLLNYFYFKNLSIKDLSMVRKLIEPFSAKTAARTMTDKEISDLKKLNTTAKKYLKANDYNGALKYEIALHTKIAEQTNNPLIVLLMEFVEDILVYYKKVFHIGIDDLDVILKAHDKIYQAIKDRDEDRA